MFLGRRFFIIFFIYHCSFPVVQNNARDYTFGALFGTTWVTFWHHLGDFGRHLGTSWAPRGSQNRAFWHQVAPNKSKKKTIAKKWHRLLIARCFLAPLGRFWAPFGTQLGAKGLPKSSFLVPSRTKMLKNETQNEASKNIRNFDRNLMRKCEILDVLNLPKCFV